MSPAASGLFEIQDIANAGRGVIAVQHLPAGTPILESDAPAFHVVLKPYSKETCANCFLWDRGRTLPIRNPDTAKFFCSVACESSWVEDQGDLGLQAWRSLAAFVRLRGKGTNVDDTMGDGPKPSMNAIDLAWTETEIPSKALRQFRQTDQFASKADRKLVQGLQRKMTESIDVDTLSYFVSGVLFHHKHPTRWHAEILDLAMDEQPYRTTRDLEVSCMSYLQLLSILPVPLLSSLTSDLCRTMVRADNHNAFGIRAGETGEEYMGYAVYPVASYFNHSCNPNLDKRRVGNCWVFTVARDIAPGEECCITYMGGDEKDMRRFERHSRLKEMWCFDCACERCLIDSIA